MKIAVFGINYYPEVTGIGVYTTQMCEYLAQKGHQVTVLAGFPYYPFGEDFSWWYKSKGISRRRIYYSEVINAVALERVNFYKPGRPAVFARIIHEFSFFLLITLKAALSRASYDLIICVSPPLLLGLTAFMLSKLKKAPFIFHVQDLQPDSAVELGIIKSKFLINWLLRLERFIYLRAGYVLTISKGMLNRIIKKGIPAQKAGIFYNWADPEAIKPLSRDNPFRRACGIGGEFVVLHAGNMGAKQDMQVILNAALRLKDEKGICFLLAGAGVKRRQVEDFIVHNCLANIILVGPQPAGRLSEMFSCCDAALVTQVAAAGDIVMPSKIFGPASCQRPLIVASCAECEVSRLAREHNFGLVIPPEDPGALTEAILRLKADKGLCEELGRQGRIFMERNRKKDIILDGFINSFLNKAGKE